MNAVKHPEMAPDDATRLLELLAPSEQVTFQTFDDDKARRQARGKAHDPFAKWMHGTLAQYWAKLAGMNASGAGIYWMVNAGDGKGRKATNVRRIRALFVDLDGAPLEPVTAAQLRPHAIIESSANRWHAYWRVTDCALADFKHLQQALAARFDADSKVCDLPRVLRLPGFDHRKGKPYRSRIIDLHDGPAYSVAELVQTFDLSAPATPAPAATVTPLRNRRALPDVIPEGKRNNTLLSLAAGLVRKGFDRQAVKIRLQRINAKRCTPPLNVDEVDTITAHAVGYGSEGYRILTDELLDSSELNALPLASRWIIIRAFRRYDGHHDDNIALTWADCRDIPGCADEKAFMRYRKLAVASGILQLAKQGRMTRDGKTPNLYGIARQYLRSHTGRITQLAHTG